MTDEQINQRIAEACGWEVFRKPLSGCEFAAYAKNPNGDPSPGIPDYCNDLNAMAEAEGTLSLDRLYKLEAHLKQIAGAVCFRATARQRAEAFLRTLGKWKATDKDSLTVGATTEESSADQKEQSSKVAKMEEALKRIRDCNWVITLPDRMDAVRAIAREALE